jgi:hypothetical protein
MTKRLARKIDDMCEMRRPGMNTKHCMYVLDDVRRRVVRSFLFPLFSEVERMTCGVGLILLKMKCLGVTPGLYHNN